MKFWIDFFKDKRFGWRFKIANFVMNDYLRNYLAVGTMTPLEKANEYCESGYEKVVKKQIGKAIKSVNEIFEM